jgi:hypothetical protein
MALRRGGAAAVAAALVDLGRNREKEAVGAREGSARRLGLRARPFRFQRALAKAVELAHGIAQDAAHRIFLPRALFCFACWSAFLITTRAILAVFCARRTYTAPVGDALKPIFKAKNFKWSSGTRACFFFSFKFTKFEHKYFKKI